MGTKAMTCCVGGIFKRFLTASSHGDNIVVSAVPTPSALAANIINSTAGNTEPYTEAG